MFSAWSNQEIQVKLSANRRTVDPILV